MSINRSSLPKISAQTKATWSPVRHDTSAGGVAYRRLLPEADSAHPQSGQLLDGEKFAGKKITGEVIEVALIATRGGRRWQLPKGSREADESSLQTAIREVHEEVGLMTEDEGFLLTIDYWYWDTYRKDVAELVHKSVDFYLLRVIGGILNDDSYEVDAVGWFGLEEAGHLLTFAGERKVLEAAQEKLGAAQS